MPNNINDKMKEAVKKSTFNNNQSSTPINTTNKKKDTINFNNVIKNLSTSPNTKPWYKKKASIIGMSSTLGVGVLATAIAVPIVLTSKPSSTVVPPKTPIAIEEFNAKPLTEKITIYNSIVENTTNKAAIASYFLDYKVTGFNNFFLANIDETREILAGDYNKFKAFLMTSSSSSSTNPFLTNFGYGTNNNNNILNMIGSGSSSVAAINAYFFADSVFNSKPIIFSMYSPIVDNIGNLSIQSDFSIKISFKSNATNNTMAAYDVNILSSAPFQLYYKQDIILNNSTSFPNMQEYVKTNILNIS